MSTGGTNWHPNLGTGGTQLPVGAEVGMAASEDPTEDDLILLNASGYGVVADGTQVNARLAGIMYPDKRSDVNTTAGRNVIRVFDGVGSRYPQKSGDGFTIADSCVPAYISAQREVAKTASASGVGRSIGGLFLRLERNGVDAIVWSGPIGQLLARASLIADNFTFGEYKIADAAASSTLTERAFARVKVPGVVTGIDYSGAAFSASNSDYLLITIKRYNAYDSYASGVTVATYDSRAANQGAAAAFTPAAFALSGTAANLRLLPGDVLTITETKTGSGQQAIGDIDVVGKVI